jgi:hypothetical protein
MDGEYSRKWHQSVGGGIWISILEAFLHGLLILQEATVGDFLQE